MDNDQRLKLTQEAWSYYRNVGSQKIEDLYYITLSSYSAAVKEKNATAISKYGYTLAMLCLMSSRDINWMDDNTN